MEKSSIARHTGGGGNEPQGRQGITPEELLLSKNAQSALINHRKNTTFPANTKNIPSKSNTAKRQMRGDLVPAFTLAEVLITLGIIGIVAAMTLPTLIAKYQKNVTAVKVKKFYSVFNQAFKLAQLEFGEFKYWQFQDSSDLYYKYLKKYVKVLDVQTNVQISGSFTDGVVMTLADGSQAVCSKNINGSLYGDKLGCVYLAKPLIRENEFWDYSGSKGPRYIFWFWMNENKGQLEPPYLDRDDEFLHYRCSYQNLPGNGYFTCSTLLYKNGWEFKDDYPW